MIGGDYQGGGDLPRARATIVGPDAVINADAKTFGDGGTVIVWADEVLRHFGNISARGGAESGNGGFVETSGLLAMDILNAPDLSAAKGNGGEWLIDPINIEIVPGIFTENITADAGSFDIIYESTGGLFTTSATLGANVIILALNQYLKVTILTGAGSIGIGNITVNAPISWGNVATLSLAAHNNIFINEPIVGYGLQLIALGGLVSVAPGVTIESTVGVEIAANDIWLFGSINAPFGSVHIAAPSYDQENLEIGIGGPLGTPADGILSICSGGSACGMSLTGGELSRITAEELHIASGSLFGGPSFGGNIYVDGVLGFTSQNIGKISLVPINVGPSVYFINNPSTFNSLTVLAYETIEIKTDISTVNGNMELVANGSINSIPSTINIADGVTLSATGVISLNAPTNGILIDAQGDLTLEANGEINIWSLWTSPAVKALWPYYLKPVDLLVLVMPTAVVLAT